MKNLLNIFTKKPSITILTYHGIVDEISNARLQRNFHTVKQFAKHIEILKQKKYKFLNANELFYYIENPEKIKNQKLVCITFDDGYQNNLKAIEILNKYNASGIFFISSSVINTDISIWTVNLSLLILEGNLPKIKFADKTYYLSNFEERNLAFNEIRNHLKLLNAADRTNRFDEITKQFPENELEKLIVNHPYFKMLTWEEMKKVQSENIQFQSHGHFHEIHHQNQLTDTIESEIVNSKNEIEQNLKNNVFLFAYPNGNYNQNADLILQNNGYKAALILGQTKYYPKNNKFGIPRFTANGKVSKFLKQIL